MKRHKKIQDRIKRDFWQLIIGILLILGGGYLIDEHQAAGIFLLIWSLGWNAWKS